MTVCLSTTGTTHKEGEQGQRKITSATVGSHSLLPWRKVME